MHLIKMLPLHAAISGHLKSPAHLVWPCMLSFSLFKTPIFSKTLTASTIEAGAPLRCGETESDLPPSVRAEDVVTHYSAWQHVCRTLEERDAGGAPAAVTPTNQFIVRKFKKM